MLNVIDHQIDLRIYLFLLILELLIAPSNLTAMNISSKSVLLSWQVCQTNQNLSEYSHTLILVSIVSIMQ